MSVAISLKGKNALVTGGGAGMGKCTAMMLAEAGANVFVADIKEDLAKAVAEEIANTYGVKTGYCKCDVSKKAEVENMVAETVKAFGRLDICDHIGGVFTDMDFMTAGEEEFDIMFDVNTKGTFLVDQACVKAMAPNHSGKIVNMCSQTGKWGFPTNVAYTGSKFGVHGLTCSIAQYCCTHNYNINVNCVCPGIVKTNIWTRVIDKMNAEGKDGEAYFESRLQDIPLKRAQTMEDIAHMFLYLSSDWADNMTGQSINITGGKIMD